MWKPIAGMWAFGIFIMLLMEAMEITFIFFFGIPPIIIIPVALMAITIYLLWAVFK